MSKIDNLFDFGFSVKNQNYNIVKLAKTTNIFALIILGLFSIINITIKHNYTLAYIEIFFFFCILILMFLYKKYKNVELYLLGTTTILFFLSLAFYINIEKSLFTDIWLLFFPISVFLLNGLKIGRIFASIYFLVIVVYSYFGIGVYTDFVGFLRISIALGLLSYFIYLFEKSRKDAYDNMIKMMNHLEEISHKDSLTQLYNRHFLNTEILQNKEYSKKSFIFCITDIDNFKAYNDHYGHQKGDDALKTVAQIKQDTMGKTPNSFVIRLGGEEFGTFIFDSLNPEENIQKFFAKLKEKSIEHQDNKPFKVFTVSMGAVICEENKNFDFSKIYQLADEALYEAKKTGKNKVIYKKV